MRATAAASAADGRRATACKVAAVRLPRGRVRPSTALLPAWSPSLATAPAWIVQHPPLQDLPFHFATLRVIHSIHDPAFGFADVYRLNLLHTEYLLYYVVGDLLAYVVGVNARERRLMCLYLGGMPLAMRALLRAARRGRAAEPLRRAAPRQRDVLHRAAAVRVRLPADARSRSRWPCGTSRSRRRARGVAARRARGRDLLRAHLAVRALRARLHRALPVDAPAPVAPVGGAARRGPRPASRGGCFGVEGRRRRAVEHHADIDARSRGRHASTRWSIDVFRDDERRDLVPSPSASWRSPPWACRWATAIGASRRRAGWSSCPSRASLGYFTLGKQLGDVWLFGQRFAMPGADHGGAAAAHAHAAGAGSRRSRGAARRCVGSTVNVCKHFIALRARGGRRPRRRDRRDGSRAAARRGAHLRPQFADDERHVRAVPALRLVLPGGEGRRRAVRLHGLPALAGAVPGRPVPAAGRTRAAPALGVDAGAGRACRSSIPYYDYVLVRGWGFRPPPGTFHPVYRGERWTVYERDGR